jgi:hypothetical protein
MSLFDNYLDESLLIEIYVDASANSISKLQQSTTHLISRIEIILHDIQDVVLFKHISVPKDSENANIVRLPSTKTSMVVPTRHCLHAQNPCSRRSLQ